MTEIWLAFAAGIAGSFHCIGMCGGIVGALAVAAGGPLRFRLLSQLGYNLGRITTYTLLGAAVAAIGAAFDPTGLKAVSFWFFVAVNLMVALIGLGSALGFSPLGLNALEGSGARFFARPLRRLVGHPFASYPLGVLLGFMPCGLVYAPLMVAAGSGTPLKGGAIMAALGAGTLPLLFLFGTASGAISVRLRAVMFRLAGVAIFAMGAYGLWRAWSRACPHCNF